MHWIHLIDHPFYLVTQGSGATEMDACQFDLIMNGTCSRRIRRSWNCFHCFVAGGEGKTTGFSPPLFSLLDFPFPLLISYAYVESHTLSLFLSAPRSLFVCSIFMPFCRHFIGISFAPPFIKYTQRGTQPPSRKSFIIFIRFAGTERKALRLIMKLIRNLIYLWN